MVTSAFLLPFMAGVPSSYYHSWPVYHLHIICYTAQAHKVVKQVSVGEKRD